VVLNYQIGPAAVVFEDGIDSFVVVVPKELDGYLSWDITAWIAIGCVAYTMRR
jgi:hypothetical protein